MSRHGTFHWNELMTTDPEAAAGFYAALTGCGIATMPMPEGVYRVMMQGDRPVGNGMDGSRFRHHRARRAGYNTGRPSMAEITTIGLDLAKNWFQVHGADAHGRPVLRKKLARGKLLEFFANLPPCLVGMEACGSAHHWARELSKLGHEVRLMPPQYVKPYVKTNKHDAADAEAIGEAVTRPTMRFVPVKTIEQQTMAQLHRIRQLLVKQKTMQVNALRGHLAELGIVRGQGVGKAGQLMRLVEDAADDALPAKIRQQLQHLVELVRDLHRRLAEIDRELGELAREHPAARRLATIPGVGPVTATALVAAIGDIGRFRSGRQLAAYLGLVPQQHSSGGKERLGTISKRGDTYVRTLLVHGARAVVRLLRLQPEPREGWMGRLLQRRPVNVAVMAQANKTARIVWALLTKAEDYRRAAAVAT
jgi:transposase